MERLDIVVVRQDAIDLGLDKDVGDDCGEMVSCDLLVLVERVRLLNDFHDFLELLQFTQWRLLLLKTTRLLDSHLPGMLHSVIDLDTERRRRQLLQHNHFALELLFLPALIRIIEELAVQVIHHKVADLHYIVIDLFFATQELVFLQFTPRYIEQSLEQFS